MVNSTTIHRQTIRLSLNRMEAIKEEFDSLEYLHCDEYRGLKDTVSIARSRIHQIETIKKKTQCIARLKSNA